MYRDGKAVERSSSNVFTVTTDGAYAVGVTASKTSGNDTFYSREVMTSAVQCRFVEEPPYTGKYSYEVFTSVGDNGTITVDRYATEGDKVTIDVTPDEAYLLDELVVTANGKEVELTDNGDGTYTFTMPSADVRISATFAEDPDWTEPEEPATDVSDIFIDVAPNAWYKDAVQYAYAGGLMTGVSANEFAPDATTTRGMIVSMLARLEGVESANDAGFADVEGEWYATAVNWAASVGVVSGYEDNTFRPKRRHHPRTARSDPDELRQLQRRGCFSPRRSLSIHRPAKRMGRRNDELGSSGRIDQRCDQHRAAATGRRNKSTGGCDFAAVPL